MIVGADHVALSCADLDAAVAAVEAAGYRVKFRETDLPNRPEKRPYLARFAPVHAVAFAQLPGGLSLELTCHGAMAEPGPAGYAPVFDHPPAAVPPGAGAPADGATAAALRWLRPEGAAEAVRCRWPELEAPLWASSTAPGPARIGAVVVTAADLDRAVRFWSEGLGLRPAADVPAGAGFRVLDLGAAVPAWRLRLIVARELAAGDARLDERGFPCLALLTLRLEEDLARALAAGGRDASPPFALTVGGKPLRIALLRSPDGQLVELLEIATARA